MADRNVLGQPLHECGTDPVTGFYRDGCCSTDEQDLGLHTICGVMTADFLAHQRGLLGVLMHVVRNRSHVVEKLRVHRPFIERVPDLVANDLFLELRHDVSQ